MELLELGPEWRGDGEAAQSGSVGRSALEWKGGESVQRSPERPQLQGLAGT